MITVTYADHAARMDGIAKLLERVAYRLRQGAISEESAIHLLGEVQEMLDPTGSM